MEGESDQHVEIIAQRDLGALYTAEEKNPEN